VSKLLEKYFGVSKPVIVMVHFPPLPGSPLYDGKSSEDPVEWVRHDLLILQEEGVDAVMFGNEAGVDVLWDPHSTLALAKATGATFVREIFTGIYSSDMGIWNTSPGEVFRYKRLLEVDDLLLLYNINAEFAAPLAMRPIEIVAKSVVVRMWRRC
jgi:predicted TIM-barrel enzyme